MGILLYFKLTKKDAQTISEHINSFERYSRHNIISWNILWGPIPYNLKYDFLILHYSIPPDHYNYPFWMTDYLTDETKGHEVIKIAFFQDEYNHCKERFKFIEESDISIVFSLLRDSEHKKVYFDNTNVKKVKTTLAGYVDKSLIKKSKSYSKKNKNRYIDVGYRARPLPFYMGLGAQEKTNIGIKFLNLAKEKNINLDIKLGEEDRLYGEDWNRFLASCKSMLGVEAGVSIFDIDGSIREETEKYIKINPNADFMEVHENLLKSNEDNIHYRMLSPRIFEAVAFKTLLILFEGEYSKLLEPGVHYLELKKDFSNLEDVLIRLADQKEVNKITDKAFNDLIQSGKYSYKNFINEFDSFIDSEIRKSSMIFNKDKFNFKVYRLYKKISFRLNENYKMFKIAIKSYLIKKGLYG